MSIGKRIRDLRTSKGYTLQDLAEVAHTSKQTIYKYENDIITSIPYDKLVAIANKLRTPASYLMGWTKEAGTDSKVGKLIEEKRISLGISQEQLCAMLGYSRAGVINDIELGVTYPTQKQIDEIFKALMISDKKDLKIELTDKEQKLILSYRNHPELQHAVDVLLGV